MINITINNPELEALLHQAYGENAALVEQEFSRFIKETQIKRDVKSALQQIELNQTIAMDSAFRALRGKYE